MIGLAFFMTGLAFFMTGIALAFFALGSGARFEAAFFPADDVAFVFET